MFGRIRSWVDALLGVSEAGLGRWRRLALRGARLVVLVSRRFREDLCLERAASLAFSSVIAAIPAGMIALLSLQLLLEADLLPAPGAGAGGTGHATPAVERSEEPSAGGSESAGSSATVPSTPAETLLAPVIDRICHSVSEEERDEVRSALTRFAQELEVDRRLRQLLAQSEDQAGAVTAIAIFVLVLSTMTLFRSAERAFTGIWRVERRRSLFEKIATFWLLLTAAPLILAVSVTVKRVLGTTLEQGFGDASALSRAIRGAVLDGLFPLSISFFAFMLLMAYLPYTRVRLGAAAVGALVAAIGWELGTRAFELYIENTLASGVLGALGVVPFFLLWVYFSWSIVLVGAQSSYCLQHYAALAGQAWGEGRDRTFSRPTLALLIVERVYRAFRGEGAAPTDDEIAAELAVPIALVEEVANTLVGADLLVPRGGGFGPARAAERLRPSEVVALFPAQAGLRLPPGASDTRSPITDLVREADALAVTRLGRESFADLLGSPEPKGTSGGA
jgi:membrane protein